MIELLNIDCMEYMRHCGDNQFDLAIVDPPYGIGISLNPVRQAHDKHEWDKAVPPPEYFTELMRVSKNQIIWGGNYFDLPPTPCFVIWNKVQPETFSMAMCEFAWSSFTSPAKLFTQRIVSADVERIHPTQKPVRLYRWLLEQYAEPGQRILDTHLGSGSAAIAANQYGVGFVGCEIDTDYFNQANARYHRETAQIDMFEAPKSGWNEQIEVKKGDLGEELVKKYLEAKKQTVYSTSTDQGHPVDMICASQDKSNMYMVEVKAKARRKYYPDTGFDLSVYNEYKALQIQRNLTLYVFFVDEEAGKIYGGSLDDISKPTQITHRGHVLEYPLCNKGIMYFPVDNMITVDSIPKDIRGRLQKLTTKNDIYLKEMGA